MGITQNGDNVVGLSNLGHVSLVPSYPIDFIPGDSISRTIFDAYGDDEPSALFAKNTGDGGRLVGYLL